MHPYALFYDDLDTPVGNVRVVVDGRGLVHVGLPQSKHPLPAGEWQRDRHRLAPVVQQFADWFAGRRHDFDLPLHPRGTQFQCSVWHALRSIEYGQTASYAELARRIGRPRAMRAVGAANGANPLPIVVPCHRVIGADGSLTGYGGGLEAKRWLLAHERRHASCVAA